MMLGSIFTATFSRSSATAGYDSRRLLFSHAPFTAL